MAGPIDLSQLRAPDAVEQLSPEALVAAWRARAAEDNPDLAGLDVESDPAAKWARTGAYRELLCRQRVNDGARACMLATATGADLEQLVAIYNLKRETLVEGDPDADPPVAEVKESDARLRRRAQLFPASISAAGPESAYRFHALNASPLVKDAAVASPSPGSVTVTVLAEIVAAGDTGVANTALLSAVTDALNAEDVRPMGDVLAVKSAAIVDYGIKAELEIGTGPDAGAVLEAARESVRAAADRLHRLGAGAPLSALYAALHVPGVSKVSLTSPAADVAATAVQAAHASSIEVTAA